MYRCAFALGAEVSLRLRQVRFLTVRSSRTACGRLLHSRPRSGERLPLGLAGGRSTRPVDDEGRTPIARGPKGGGRSELRFRGGLADVFLRHVFRGRRQHRFRGCELDEEPRAQHRLQRFAHLGGHVQGELFRGRQWFATRPLRWRLRHVLRGARLVQAAEWLACRHYDIRRKKLLCAGHEGKELLGAEPRTVHGVAGTTP
mmetsp:Transcript_8318/g.16996  ORF Transcript_8318/g.16996 Transcript_8318/m.16996 type:complete len:201 (-) Transcript_8318:608-1210(-)